MQMGAMTVYVDDNALVIRHPRLGRLCAKVAHVWRNLEKRGGALRGFFAVVGLGLVAPPLVGFFFVLLYVSPFFLPPSFIFPEAWLMPAFPLSPLRPFLSSLEKETGAASR